MFGMGHWELIIIFLVILLVFGAKRIPEMASGLGKGIREFRKAMHEVQDEIDVNKPPPATDTRPATQLDAPPESVAQQAAAPAPDQVAASQKTQTSTDQSA
jgi:sec-independent protein translocase protein TatA